MVPIALLIAIVSPFSGAAPSPGEDRANVPVTIENGAWLLHVPASQQGPVVLRFVDKPASVTNPATGQELPSAYDAGTLTVEPPASQLQDGMIIAVTWKNDRWDKDMRAFAEADDKAPPKQGGILFVGSSTIRIWKLNECFLGLGAMNRGFGGSQYSDAVFHFDRVILPYHPATIVMYDGDNDIAAGKSPEWVFADFETLMRLIRFHLPECRVVVLSIKPCPARWKLWDKMKQVNALESKYLAKQQNMHFLDLTAPLLNAEGKPRPEMFLKDGLHFNAQGYALVSGLLRPALAAPSN